MSNDDKANHKGGAIIAVAVVLLLPLAYIGGYFAVSEMDECTFGYAPASVRTFNANWQVGFFWPALKIESRCRGGMTVIWPVNDHTDMIWPVDDIERIERVE